MRSPRPAAKMMPLVIMSDIVLYLQRACDSAQDNEGAGACG